MKNIHLLKLGDKKHHFTEKDLPALIHYKSKEWWSNYSMILIENLVLQWYKAIIFTWYPAAKAKFFTETKKIIKQTAIIKELKDIEKYADKQVIIIDGNNEKLCLATIKKLQKHIIFIKNIDICHKPLLEECLHHKDIILSGDLDACKTKNKIKNMKFASTILFSQPKTKLLYRFIPTEKYRGYIRSAKTEWYVQVVVE